MSFCLLKLLLPLASTVFLLFDLLLLVHGRAINGFRNAGLLLHSCWMGNA